MSKLVMAIGSQLRKNSAIILTIWLAWCALIVVAGRLMIEDYMTSLFGYRAIPTNKTDENLAYFVAALPTLIQIAFGWWAIEKRAPLPTVIALAAFVVDVSTNMAYKVTNWTVTGVAIAGVETFTLYTLGSEFLLMVSLENAIAYFSDAVAALIVIFSKFGEAFSHIVDWLNGNIVNSGETDRRERQDYSGAANGGQHHNGQQQHR